MAQHLDRRQGSPSQNSIRSSGGDPGGDSGPSTLLAEGRGGSRPCRGLRAADIMTVLGERGGSSERRAGVGFMQARDSSCYAPFSLDSFERGLHFPAERERPPEHQLRQLPTNRIC